MIFDFLLEKQLKIIVEKNLKEIAHEQSMIDDLTGVWNKRYLEKQLHDLEEETVVALLDLDNLKEINDTYGHLAGDRMLICLADTLQSNLRTEDDICRYGGDEFVILFRECQLEQAVARIEQIRKLLVETKVQFNEYEITTTISAGLSTVTAQNKGEKVIATADQKLYKRRKKEEIVWSTQGRVNKRV